MRHPTPRRNPLRQNRKGTDIITILITFAIWFIISIPFGIAVGTAMKRCDMLDKQRRSAPVSGVSLTRRCGDVTSAHPEISTHTTKVK